VIFEPHTIHKTIDWLTTTGGKTPKGAPAGQP
jgi:hypothetical protein